MKFVISFGIIFSILFAGCNYLDMVPEDDIETVETIFEKREQAEDWLKTCYVFLQQELPSIHNNPAYTGTDEIVVGQYIRSTYSSNNLYCWDGLFIGDGLQMVQNPYGDLWRNSGNSKQSGDYYTAIRYCNIFFEKMAGVYNMEEAEKDLWIAEVKALKAHFYFELLKHYGPIVLVNENIDPNDDIENMQFSRRPVEECVDTIVSLLDQAMKVLPPFMQKDISHQGYHCLESAATLKAQVLLYAASPLFNGNPIYKDFKNRNGELLFPQEEDKEKWRIAAEAADAALEICLTNGKTLVEGNSSYASDLRNTMMDIEYSVLASNWENSEAIFMMRPKSNLTSFWYQWTLPYFKSTDSDYNSSMLGLVSPSLKMVEMYYTENGLPIDADRTWNYNGRYQMSRETNAKYKDVVMLSTDRQEPGDEGVLGLHLRREPRFYAHIAADRCYWQRGQLANQNQPVRAYKGERYGTQENTISGGKQNIGGYWMKKGTYSNVSTKEYKTVTSREEPFVLSRLAELYLMSAEAWNEYLDAPDEAHVYAPLNVVRARAGIPDVVTSWRDYSNTPNKVTAKEGMREIIHREWDIEFAFEGQRFWNLRRWMTAQEELNEALYGWNILGEDAASFYNNYNGPVVVWSQRKFTAPRDYLFPIESEEIMMSGVVQNPGW